MTRINIKQKMLIATTTIYEVVTNWNEAKAGIPCPMKMDGLGIIRMHPEWQYVYSNGVVSTGEKHKGNIID